MDFQTYFGTLGVIAESYTTLSFKINEIDLIDVTITGLTGALARYISEQSESKGETGFMSIGEHKNGKNENEHYHINFAVPDFRKTSNESRRRTNYLESSEGIKLEGLSCKIGVIKSVMNLEDCLKYPYKEKLCIEPPVLWGYHKLPSDVRQYMIESAHAMYLASVEQQRKKSRASERSMGLLEQINELAGTRSFESYSDFKEKICKDYFSPLELHEYPDMASFRRAIEKVAVKRAIVPFHFFI